jgi:hypothetical protein
MEELTNNVNWLAVCIGAFVAYMLGWLWYSPKLFGPKWMEGVRIEFKEGDPMPMAAMLVQALGTFILAWLIGITAAQQALLTAILIALTIISLLAGAGLYCQKSYAAIAIECGFVASMVVIMIVCQGIL